VKINFLRSASWVAALTLLSRISGYCRELLLLQCIGFNAVSDTLSTLIKIPAFFRRIFAEGAMQVAFLPLFTHIKETEGEEAAYKFSSSVLGVLVVLLTLLVGIAEWKWSVCSRWVFTHPGHESQRILFTVLGKIVFPYIFFISIHSFFGSISSAYGRFGIFNFSHTLANIFILAVIVILLLGNVQPSARCAYWVAWGILGSGVLQCTFMIWGAWRSGIRPVLPSLGWNHFLGDFFKKFFAALLSVSSVQLNTIIGAWFAANLPTKGASYLNYADRFQQLPLSLVGISLTAVLLPVLAQQRALGEHHKAWRSEQYILRFSFILASWIALFFWMTAFSLVGCLLYPGLKTGALLWKDVVEIAHTVMIFSLTIPAYIGIKILITRCFAYGYAKLPWISGIINVVVTVLCSIVLRHKLNHLGLAVASVVGAWTQFVALMYAISAQEGRGIHPQLKRLFLELAPFLLGILVLHYTLHSSDAWKNATFIDHVLYLVGCAMALALMMGGFLLLRGHISRRHGRLLWKIMRSSKPTE
jgi:putative peptidoglycan lipid II flippase